MPIFSLDETRAILKVLRSILEVAPTTIKRFFKKEGNKYHEEEMMNQIKVSLNRLQEYLSKKDYPKALKEAKRALDLIDEEKSPYLTSVILLHVLFCHVQLNNIRHASDTFFQLKRFMKKHPQTITSKFLLSMHGIALKIHDQHPALAYKLWDLAWSQAVTKNHEKVKQLLIRDIIPLIMESTYLAEDIPTIHSWIDRALKHVKNKRDAFHLHLKNVIHALEHRDLEEAHKSLEQAENLAMMMVNSEFLAMVKKLEIVVLLKDVEWQLFAFSENAEEKKKLDESSLIAKLDKAENLAREFSDPSSLFQVKLLRGLLFKYLKEYSRSLEEWKSAMELKDSGVPTSTIYQLSTQIALTLAKQEHHDQALELVNLINMKMKDNVDGHFKFQIQELKASLEQLVQEKKEKERRNEGKTLSSNDNFPFFIVGPGTISYLREEALKIQETLSKSQVNDVESDSSLLQQDQEESRPSDTSTPPPLDETDTTTASSRSNEHRDESTNHLLSQENADADLSSEETRSSNDTVEDFELYGELTDLLSLEPESDEHGHENEHSPENSPPNNNDETIPITMTTTTTMNERGNQTEIPMDNMNAFMERVSARTTTVEYNSEQHETRHERDVTRRRETSGDESMNEAVQRPSRELIYNILRNMLQSRGYSIEVNLDAVSEPNIIATKGKLKKHRVMISICEDPLDAGFASTLLAGYLSQGTKVIFLLNGTPDQVAGQKNIIIISRPEELIPLLK